MPASSRHKDNFSAIAFTLLTVMCAVFAFLAVYSLFFDSVLDPQAYRDEHILYLADNAAGSVILLAVSFLLPVLLHRLFPGLCAKLSLPVFTGAALLLVTLFGLFWTTGVGSVPATDSHQVVSAASDLLKGDLSFLSQNEYFRQYPFQLGYVAVSAFMQAVTGGSSYGAAGALNVLCLTAAYGAILKSSWLLFADRRVQVYLLAAIVLFVQPIFFCTFLYGNIPGLCPAAWSAYLALSFMRKGGAARAVGSVALIALSVVCKPNYLIFAVAICAVLLFSLIRRFRIAHLIVAICILAAPLASQASVISAFENASGVSLGGGTPQTAWLAMGMQEGRRAAGWYNNYSGDILKNSGWDPDTAAEAIKQDISNRCAEFSADPKSAVDFYFEKFVSQWNETTFESLWVSRVKEHEHAISPFVESIYDSEILKEYMDIYTQWLYAAFAAGLAMLAARMLRRRRMPEGVCLFALIVLGGLAYHMLFEAKSQYLLIYLPLMLPYAAYAMAGLPNTLSAFHRAHRKNTPARRCY